MDREIKFRGKRTDNGEWIEGDFTRRKSRFIHHLDTTYGISDEYGMFCAVDLETVGQFTGLHDKNGKEIYEGDIFITGMEFVAVVEWEKEGRFLGFTVDGKRKIIYVNREPRVRVIGNIHDNPELLEGPAPCQNDI